MNIRYFLTAVMDNIDEEARELYTGETFEYAAAVLNYASAIAMAIILLLVTLMTIIDLFYINLPWAKQLYDNYSAGEQNFVKKVVTHLFVSKNAIESFEQAAVENKSPMVIYLRKSIKFYIIVTIVLTILATGIGTLMKIIVRLLSGLLGLNKEIQYYE